jgi:hypothetical protein
LPPNSASEGRQRKQQFARAREGFTVPFRIFVLGSGRFSHVRSGVAYGDEWDFGWVSAQLMKRVGVSAPASATGAATRMALGAMSRIAQLDLLVDTITLLIANHGNGTLNVHIHHYNRIMPDTAGFISLSLSTVGTPGFIARDLCRFLNDYDMNKWGVVIEILGALVSFDTTYSGINGYMINVQLSD